MNAILAYSAAAIGRLAAVLAVLMGGVISASSVLLVPWVAYAVVLKSPGALAMFAVPTAGLLLLDIGLAARRRSVEDAAGMERRAEFELTGRDRGWFITTSSAGLLLGLIQAAFPAVQAGLLARLASASLTAGSFWLLAAIIAAAGGLGRLWSRKHRL